MNKFDELQAENEALAEDNRLLHLEIKNTRRGLNIVHYWLCGQHPYSELSRDEIISMIEKVACIPPKYENRHILT